jgi:hypothetical protein
MSSSSRCIFLGCFVLLLLLLLVITTVNGKGHKKHQPKCRSYRPQNSGGGRQHSRAKRVSESWFLGILEKNALPILPYFLSN